MDKRKIKKRVFMEIVIGRKNVGRIIFDLFYDITPKTSENFYRLCTGDYNSNITNKKLSYLGSKFTKIVQNDYIEGGELSESIYGKYFNDENFQRRHTSAGLLSMSSSGKNTNCSKFLITLSQCMYLDGKNVIFGHVTQGMEIIREISKLPIDINERPKVEVVIFKCGDFEIGEIVNRENVFLNVLKQVEIRRKENTLKINEKLKGIDIDVDRDVDDDDHNRDVYDDEDSNLEEEEDSYLDEEEEDDNIEIKNTIKQSQLDNNNIKLMINEAKRNNIEYLKEDLRRMKKKNNPFSNIFNKDKEKSINIKRGIPERFHDYLNIKHLKVSQIDSINTHNTRKKKKNTQNNSIFNSKSNETKTNPFSDDALYKAYFTRLREMPFDLELYKEQMKMEDNPDYNYIPSKEKIELMQKDLQKQIEKRKTYSKRRTYYEDDDVLFINERNRKYNNKLERYFGREGLEAKANIERGSAV